MRDRLIPWTAACLFALTAARAATPDATLTIGDKAPAIDIEHWVQDRGGAFKPIKDFTPGKVYVIEFWATSCPPCVQSIPHIAELQDAYADRGVTVIGVSRDDIEEIEHFLDQKVDGTGEQSYRDVTKAYCLATDPDGSVYEDYAEAADENGIPTAFIVGKTGEIEWIGHPMEMDEPLEQIVNGGWDRVEYARERKESKAWDFGFLEELAEAEEINKEVLPLLREGKGAQALERFDALAARAPTESLKRLWAHEFRPAVAMLAGGTLALEVFRAKVKAADGSTDKLNEAALAVVAIPEEGIKADADLVAAAVAAVRKATRPNPARGDGLDTPAYLYDTLAHLYEMQGNLEKAIATQREAVKQASAAQRSIESHLQELEKKAAAQ